MVGVKTGIVSAIKVTVHKPQAPLTVAFTDVTITIVRVRP